MTDKNTRGLAGIDIKKIVKAATKELDSKGLDEAFYASPKNAPQVTEFVTQKTKDAHDALYRGHVEQFNRASAEIDAIDRARVASEPGKFSASKRAETEHMNASWLHELFFANCFDPNSNVYSDSVSFIKLQASFGSFDDWQRDFIACATVAGQGWAICGYSTFLRAYVNTIVSDNCESVMLGLFPVIVLDMHEHSRRDYLNDKQSYVVAMMQELNWNVIDERFERTEALARIVKQ